MNNNLLLNTDLILIYWKQRSWKSMFATYLSIDRINRLYWNIEIYYQWINIVKRIKSYKEFKNFKIWSKSNIIPWYMIIDEIGFNFNSKDIMSDRNKTFSEFIFLQGKYNLSTIWISQRWSSIPRDLKELASHIYEVEKIPIWFANNPDRPFFKVTRQKYIINEDRLEFVSEKILDLIWLLEMFEVSYNTLDESIIN